MANSAPKVGIIGLGMVGKPLKRFFEEKGYVVGQNLFLSDPAQGFTDDINQADIVFLAVPTPRTPTGAADTTIVSAVLKNLKPGKIAVIKSTVPPGTTEQLQNENPDLKMLFNPEFLTEKTAWYDFMNPDRQIVGFTPRSKDAAPLVLSLLPKAPFMSPSADWAITATEAETIKYASNVFLAHKVVFANMLFQLAEKMGLNYENIRLGMGTDPRIGPSHLEVSYEGYKGFGGYCFPKDTAALISHLESVGLPDAAKLIRGMWDYNVSLLGAQGLTIDQVSGHSFKI